MAERQPSGQAAHPTPLTYVKVAATLAVLTAAEVAVFYIDFLEPVFLPTFLILSVAKFALVVLFYMHLKFDSRLFSGMFVGGLLLAVAVSVAVMALFQVLSAKANPPEDGAVVAATLTPTPTPRPTPVPTQEEPTRAPTVAGGPTATEPPPEPTEEEPQDLVAAGREVFLTPPASVGPQPLWCSACHTIEGVSQGLVGPELTHIGTDSATRKPGMSAEEYILESIRDSEEFVAEGVPRALPGLMTKAIVGALTDGEVDALVAFLLEQK